MVRAKLVHHHDHQKRIKLFEHLLNYQPASQAYNTKISEYKAEGKIWKVWIEGAKTTLEAYSIPSLEAFWLAQNCQSISEEKKNDNYFINESGHQRGTLLFK